MSDTPKNEDTLGTVLVQVQDDLRQLKHSLGKITISEKGETLDIQALDTAIRRTERGIRKRAEEYLKTVNKQLLILPSIEDLQKKTIQLPKWNPTLESFTDTCPQRGELPGPSPGEKHKSALTMRLLCNPAHPKNRAIMHQKFGIPLPDLHKKSANSETHHRVITGPTMSIVPGGHRNLARPEEDMRAGLTDWKSRCHKQLTWGKEPGPTHERTGRECTPTWTTKAPAPPPSATSKSTGYRSMMQGSNCLTPESHQNVPVLVPIAISKFPFTITEGRTDPMAADFCRFKQHYCLCWGNLVDALEALEKLLREFAVPLAKVCGERLADFGLGWDIGWRRAPPLMGLLSVLENREQVLDLVLRPGQRYTGEGGIEAAAIRIQSCWRRYLARTTYLRHCRRKWAAGTIAISWLMHAQMRRVRKALQARRFRQLENYRNRAQHLATNWKHIQSSKRTIIHIPSLGYSQSQRLSLKGFDVLQNIQISRLCDVRDENVEVIYVSPRHLGDDILHYYSSLLKLHGASEVGDAELTQSSSCIKRFTILTPDAVEYFPTHNMCLSTLLKYSPRTLQRIRNLIQGKEAYIVGGVAHVDDLAVADELGVPILGPEPVVAQLYGTKSGGRRIFAGAEVDVTPGQGDIYSLNQLHETLARLMTQNMDVQRWLFKVDSEQGGRGTAYCDVCHLSCYNWALQEYRRHGPDLWNTEWVQEPVLLRYLDEVPEWLAHHAQPAKTSCYPNWACFLKTFLRQGGVVEAYPPSDSVTCLTVDLLLEPGGVVTMLSCGDQLHGSCQLETVGSSVPQTSVCPDTLHSICMRVGRACLQRLIIGYVSLDLATFLNHSTLEQKVWAIDVDLRYSNQLAMTQMLLILTGGTLDCRTCRLEVPVPIKEKSSARQIAAKPPAANRYAVIGSRLFHTNLSMVYPTVFFKMCKAQGIGFDMKRKEGTVFALHDSSERGSLGMVTVSEDLQGALVTFARNLSVIQQEISSPKMQGETNFKDLIKDIEDVLQMTVQNNAQAVEDNKAAT
ncbi:IQ motif-containing protein H [Centroberyx affinis]|uniref:IQ motif-containing protein H n=1 Tax=Centroberyx affinis TaxID=166261 RepID=UPI003A5C3282